MTQWSRIKAIEINDVKLLGGSFLAARTRAQREATARAKSAELGFLGRYRDRELESARYRAVVKLATLYCPCDDCSSIRYRRPSKENEFTMPASCDEIEFDFRSFDSELRSPRLRACLELSPLDR